MNGHDVEIVDSFVYLGSCIDTAGGSEHDASRRIDVEFYLYPTVSTALVHSVKPKLTE